MHRDAPAEHGIHVVVARLRDDADARRAWLSDAERKRAARLRSGVDRGRYIAAHATLRELLAARVGEAPASLQLESDERGKPALRGSDVQFSLSRSEGLAAFAIACGRAVGIDIEAVRPLADADAIAARMFPRLEYRAYAALPAPDRIAGFFRGWTRTEALAKALGGGIGLPPSALDAALEDGWVVRSFVPAPGFGGAVAWA
jgi:4'-phosphopantetheinyl transferase